MNLTSRSKLLLAFLLLALTCAWGATRMSSLTIINSTLDNSCVGCSIPAAGAFTNVQVTYPRTGVLPTQGGYLAWNVSNGQGETDFLNQPGTGTGGFNWYNGATPSLIMTLSPSGGVGANNFSANNVMVAPQGTFGNVQINGNDTLTLSPNAGLYLGHNISNGSGESDFVNQRGVLNTGGFAWFDTSSSTAWGTAIAVLDRLGNFTANSFNGNLTGNFVGTGTLTGNVVGNASTATTAGALTNTPNLCGAGRSPTGILPNGNATGCGPLRLEVLSSPTCTTPSGANQTCSFNVSWPSPGFSGGTYAAGCTGEGPSGSGGGVVVQVAVIGKTGSYITVQFENGTADQGNPASFSAIDCWGSQP